jgi:hypothetical protein
MTTPKIPTVHKGDSRLYVWDGGEYPGVTSVVGMLPKPALQYWAAKKVAEAAVERGKVTERDINWLKAAPKRDLNQAANKGSSVHDTLDRLVNGEPVDIPDDERGFIDGFHQFCDRYNPEFLKTEETVHGEYGEYGYCGSFDAIISIAGETWLIDFKTTRSGVHPEVAIQLAAYANAHSIIHPDGSSEPMSKIDRFGVLWLRPEEWAFVELGVTQDPEDNMFKTFGALLGAWHWENRFKKTAIGVRQASGRSSAAPF